MTRRAARAAAPKPDDTLQVAYHAGPPSIEYGGAHWKRGVPQKITGAAWETMQARPDFTNFDFRITPPDTPAEQE